MLAAPAGLRAYNSRPRQRVAHSLAYWPPGGMRFAAPSKRREYGRWLSAARPRFFFLLIGLALPMVWLTQQFYLAN